MFMWKNSTAPLTSIPTTTPGLLPTTTTSLYFSDVTTSELSMATILGNQASTHAPTPTTTPITIPNSPWHSKHPHPPTAIPTPSTSPLPSNSPRPTKASLPVPIIAGISAAILAPLILLGLCIYLYIFRKRQRRAARAVTITADGACPPSNQGDIEEKMAEMGEANLERTMPSYPAENQFPSIASITTTAPPPNIPSPSPRRSRHLTPISIHEEHGSQASADAASKVTEGPTRGEIRRCSLHTQSPRVRPNSTGTVVVKAPGKKGGDADRPHRVFWVGGMDYSSDSENGGEESDVDGGWGSGDEGGTDGRCMV